jgi:hypothetical protein
VVKLILNGWPRTLESLDDDELTQLIDAADERRVAATEELESLSRESCRRRENGTVSYLPGLAPDDDAA